MQAADKEDVKTDVMKLVISGTSSNDDIQRWTTPATTTSTPRDDNNNDDCIDKTNADEFHAAYQHAICPATTALYGHRLLDFDNAYDYNYSQHYPSSRYASSFQGPASSSSSYIGAVTPYAAPYSPSSLNAAYTFNLAGPCAAAGAAAYNSASSYMMPPHHLTSPSAAAAALLSSERSAPSSFRFNTSASSSLLQPRQLVLNLIQYASLKDDLWYLRRNQTHRMMSTIVIGDPDVCLSVSLSSGRDVQNG